MIEVAQLSIIVLIEVLLGSAGVASPVLCGPLACELANLVAGTHLVSRGAGATGHLWLAELPVCGGAARVSAGALTAHVVNRVVEKTPVRAIIVRRKIRRA